MNCSSSLPEDSCTESLHAKGPSPESQFEKNYPKNLFIPMVQYLSEMGYKQAYELSIGTLAWHESRNVVPLNTIFTLISAEWFTRNINIDHLLTNISNKILLNSKIKKKLFHLLLLRFILQDDYLDEKDFRRRVSKQANLIPTQSLPHDELFDSPNAVIYLLKIFRKILSLHLEKKAYKKLEQQLAMLQLQDESHLIENKCNEGKCKNIGSKEEYKYQVKELVNCFNGKSSTIVHLTDAFEEIKQGILEKDKQIKSKYCLNEGIPNWTLFIELVVVRCFEHKRKDQKITNSLLNQWVNQYRNRIFSIPTFAEEKNQLNSVKEAKPIESSWTHCESEKQAAHVILKHFTPIIVSNQQSVHILKVPSS